MKRPGSEPVFLAVILSLALLVGCSSDAGNAKNARRGSPADKGTNSSAVTTSGSEATGQKVYHRMAIGETVDIHGMLVTVTSVADGPVSADGRRTFVVHVKCKVVPDPSSYSAEGTAFSPQTGGSNTPTANAPARSPQPA